MFRHQYTGLPAAETIWPALMRIGTRCWKDALETKEKGIEEDGDTRLDPEGQTDPPPFEWTPAVVTRAILDCTRGLVTGCQGMDVDSKGSKEASSLCDSAGQRAAILARPLAAVFSRYTDRAPTRRSSLL